MDSQGWRMAYQMLVEESRALWGRRRGKYRYSDALIGGLFLWAVWPDRPVGWACDRSHYYGPFRPRRVPSESQFSRRVRSDRTRELLTRVFCRLAEPDRPTSVCCLDGKPLVVGSCSKDRDARAGRIYGGFARGYKLHTITTEDRRILCWSVMPLNVDERKVAEVLVDTVQPKGLLLADGNYDSSPLYDQVSSGGGHLLTPVPPHAESGHPRQSPARLAVIVLWVMVGEAPLQ